MRFKNSLQKKATKKKIAENDHYAGYYSLLLPMIVKNQTSGFKKINN